MFGGWYGQADRLDAVGRESVQVAENTRAEFRSDFLGALGVRVNDADQLSAFDFAPDADVVASEIADADDSYADGFLAQDLLFASKAGDAVAAKFAGAKA